MTENTTPKQSWGFQKGQSGNPAGKPRGARHKTTLLAEKLMQDDVEKIVNAVLTAARNGDMTAAKIILDRIAPVRRGRVFVSMPETVRPDDEVAARAEILREVLGGNLTPAEGVEISNLIEVFVKKLKGAESNKLWARLGEGSQNV
jgi:hypothetical protein